MLEKLEWATRAIAQEPETQRTLFPSFVEVADELALAWEEALIELGAKIDLLGEAQQVAVRALDTYMSSVSGPANYHVWTIEGLESASEWVVMRNLARNVLREIGWAGGPPPLSDAQYIQYPEP